MSLLLLAWKEGLVSFSSKSGAPLRVPKEGSLLESLQKGLMGVVSKLVNEGGKASCCLPGFFPLCCQSQQIFGGGGRQPQRDPWAPAFCQSATSGSDVNWVISPVNEVILKCKECFYFPNFLISQLVSVKFKTHPLWHLSSPFLQGL